MPFSNYKNGSVEKLWGQYAKAITLEARFRWMQYSHQHKILPMPSCRIGIDHTQPPTISLPPSSLMYWSQRDNMSTSQRVPWCFECFKCSRCFRCFKCLKKSAAAMGQRASLRAANRLTRGGGICIYRGIFVTLPAIR